MGRSICIFSGLILALQGLLFDDVLDRYDLWYHFSRHHRTAWGGKSMGEWGSVKMRMSQNQ